MVFEKLSFETVIKDKRAASKSYKTGKKSVKNTESNTLLFIKRECIRNKIANKEQSIERTLAWPSLHVQTVISTWV